MEPVTQQTTSQAPARTVYDARGLVEPHADVPKISVIADGRASFDASELSTRQINRELRWLLYDEGVTDVTVRKTGSKHSIGAGLLLRATITVEGSLGYFGFGIIDGPEVHITGRVGWSVCENMMSGVVVIDGNAGSCTGAAIRGGDLVVRGSMGARTGIDQKGGLILNGGNAGSNTGFMMQRGHQIHCGNVGPGLGDSMYDGTIYVGGTVASLGVDCVEAELDDSDEEYLERKLGLYDIERADSFRKFVCAKKLWNYDNLEPSERKLVL